jgi:hypothetical protein
MHNGKGMHIRIKPVLNSRVSKGCIINSGNIAKATRATGHKRITKRDVVVLYLSEPEGIVGHQFKVNECLN